MFRQMAMGLVLVACLGSGVISVRAQSSAVPAVQAEKAEQGWPDRLAGHGGPIKSVVLSEDGKRALTASFDYSVILWALDREDGRILHRLEGHKAAVNDATFIPGTNKAVSVGDDGAVAIWDLDRGALIELIEDTGEKALDVAVSLDGKLAAVARWDGTARLFDLVKGKEVDTLSGHDGNVNAVAFSQDGRTLYTAAYDGRILVWPIADGRISGSSRLLHAAGWGVNVLATLPGGSLLAFGTIDGDAGVADLETGDTAILKDGDHPVLALATSPRASTFALGTANGEIAVFDIETGAEIESYGDLYGPVWGLSFTPEGDQLYRAGLDDFAIRWQVSPTKPFQQTPSVYPRRFQAYDVEDPGEREFLRKCSVCHTLTPDDANRAGPTLYGLFGRKAGTVDGYAYSEALKNSDIIWTAETVGRLFDDGPDVMTPGTKMPIQRLKSVERRDALVDYLARATAPVGDMN
ncbi:WD domain/cytochrome c family protein [Fulvimarina pelagi HTCC2506]|uniref:WD domain/cytochrome c family protein n=1 Tax=Fulvimarina pelagi HTCC2506 TaxID=314231 RepID=Q0G146_9HYPH|nr:c-type cytochrome [Fulvimarina pelagi]EAU40793.1 WD domain/cytochrome c family protein [Fulvimarina pelagi HTCC2506]